MRVAKEREAFDDARRAEREAVDRLTREAAKLLEERGSTSEAIPRQVAESLRAAAISEEGRELLARGRFTQAFEGDGFDVISSLQPATPVRRSRASAKKLRDGEAHRKAKAELADAKLQLKDAERVARAAEAEVASAQRAVDEAQARLDRL